MECSSKNEIVKFKEILNGELEMKYLCETKRIVGMDIMRSRKKSEFFLSQFSYLKKVVEPFIMQDVKIVITQSIR